ncbi:MAG: GAF domain-containing protein [Flavobacteriales bacterium]
MFYLISSVVIFSGVGIGFIMCRRHVAKLEAQQLHHKQEQLAIQEFASAVVNQDNIDELLWMLMRSCISKLGFVDGVVYLYDRERRVLVQKAAFGPKNPDGYEIKNRIELELGRGIVGNVALNQKPEIVYDTSKDPRYIAEEDGRFSEMAVPICYKGELIGVIDSEHPQKGFFKESHLHLVETLSCLCAGKIIKLRAISNRKLYVKRLQTLLEHTPDFVLLSAPNGDCKYANKSYLQFFGIEESEFGKQQAVRIMTQEQKAEFISHITKLDARHPGISYIKQSFGANRKSQWTLWSETAIFDEEGYIHEVISMGRDVTELRKAQESKDLHIKTLEEIMQQNSHRVRQPVTQLLGIAQLLELRKDNNAEMDEMIGYIKLSVSQLDSYTRELNEFVFNSSRS